MQKITEIWMDDACCDERGMGSVLYVHFQNGEGIIVSLDSKADEPLFRDVLEGKCRDRPQTDGRRVYWKNGASLSVREMFAMLKSNMKDEDAEGKYSVPPV